MKLSPVTTFPNLKGEAIFILYCIIPNSIIPKGIKYVLIKQKINVLLAPFQGSLPVAG